MSAVAEPSPAEERAWWLHALRVLQSPRSVFRALGESSESAAVARQEPVLALVILSGIAVFLLDPFAGRLLDELGADALVVAVTVFVAGASSGVLGYWLGGLALHVGARGAGSERPYVDARHTLAFAAAPLALSLLLLWPLRLALYGGDLFRSGGSDAGTAGRTLDRLELVFVGWSVVLLAVGVRVVYALSRPRALATLALATVTLFAIFLVIDLLG